MDQKKWNRALGSVGFYAILAILLVAVGTAGYFVLYRGNTPDAAPDQEPDQQITVNTAPELDGDSQMEVSGPAELPAEDPVPTVEVPEIPVEDNTPVTVSEPTLIVLPLSGEVVTAFSVDELLYDATMGDWRTHAGVDIEAAAGTNVLAACAGTVSSVYDDALMGTTVVLSHSNGYQTTYSNLQAEPAVSEGDTVSVGQVLGAVGTTSIAEKQLGPHLHFSVTQDGDVVNPDEFLNR